MHALRLLARGIKAEFTFDKSDGLSSMDQLRGDSC